jgi:hypothetical protein
MNTNNPKKIIVPDNEITIIRSEIPKLTKQVVSHSIGVSWDTWRRIEKRQEITFTTYNRILNFLSRKNVIT